MPETVYISSTFNDLKDFRQGIFECTRQLGDYYRTLGMEDYTAEDIHFVERCQNDVAACDVYILLLGNRYGYLPKGFDKSITELEYETALACQQQGKQMEILVFKVGDFCKTYNYQEQSETYIEYNQDFLDRVSERSSPKPFDSKAELQLQVSHALMKRLFRQLKNGSKIIAPDRDAVLCYCDRTTAITSLKRNVLLKGKRIFFLQGDRMNDYPGGIVKRFAKYSLGSQNKIEPMLSITGLADYCDSDNSYESIFINILEYINRPVTLQNIEIKGFLKELSLVKSNKVIFPFYYNSRTDEEFESFKDFLCFLNSLFEAYGQEKQDYELYIIIISYQKTPDKEMVDSLLANHAKLKDLALQVGKLPPVSRDDIVDWIEAFITSMEISPTVYNAYFNGKEEETYYMQEVNVRLGQLIEDLQNGSEKILSII